MGTLRLEVVPHWGFQRQFPHYYFLDAEPEVILDLPTK
jgi:hypothetical protein